MSQDEHKKLLQKLRNKRFRSKESNKIKAREYYAKRRAHYTILKREWFHRNKARLRKQNPMYQPSRNIRTRIAQYVRQKGYVKSASTFQLVGCSPEELRKHLEGQFQAGMSWDNYGEWHIDHIKPLDSAHTQKEFETLCHFSNLQPLWAHENLSKGAKILTFST